MLTREALNYIADRVAKQLGGLKCGCCGTGFSYNRTSMMIQQALAAYPNNTSLENTVELLEQYADSAIAAKDTFTALYGGAGPWPSIGIFRVPANAVVMAFQRGDNIGAGLPIITTASFNVEFGNTSFDTTVQGGSTVAINVGGTDRIRADGTGLGLFNVAPIARPTITGSRGGNAAVASIATQGAALGAWIDGTSA